MILAMSEEALIHALLEKAKTTGRKLSATNVSDTDWFLEGFGKVTACRFTNSITIDFDDVFAYWAPDRPVKYCEGNASVLRQILLLLA